MEGLIRVSEGKNLSKEANERGRGLKQADKSEALLGPESLDWKESSSESSCLSINRPSFSKSEQIKSKQPARSQAALRAEEYA